MQTAVRYKDEHTQTHAHRSKAGQTSARGERHRVFIGKTKRSSCEEGRQKTSARESMTSCHSNSDSKSALTAPRLV